MPVDEINSVNSALPTVLQSRGQAPHSLPYTPLDALNSAPVAAAQGLTPVEQAALLVNETLQNLSFTPPSPADILLLNKAAAQNLTPVEQVALLVNTDLENLGFTPPLPANILLIDETSTNPAALAAAQDLTPVQQVALSVNATLQTLSATPQAAPETTASPAAAGDVVQGLNTGLPNLTLSNAATAETATAETATGVNLNTPAVMPTQATTPATDTTAASQNLNLIPLPVAQPNLDTNPIAVPVYEIRDQKPAPSDPKPKRKEILPSLPIGRTRPVDPLVLRQEWEKRKANRLQEEIPARPSLVEERSIRQMVSQVNEDLGANGLPLHLVLAKSNEGYTLDIYDCSDNEVCRLAQEVPLDLNELLTILDNLQHETGIIINIMT